MLFGVWWVYRWLDATRQEPMHRCGRRAAVLGSQDEVDFPLFVVVPFLRRASGMRLPAHGAGEAGRNSR